MYEVKFNCELITPLFITGAYNDATSRGREVLELREQSIKGLLRFWWRILQIDILNRHSYADYEKLLMIENGIFGGETKRKNEKGNKEKVKVKSKVTIKVDYDKQNWNKNKGEDFVDVLEGKRNEKNNPRFDRKLYGGLAYLFYSVFTLKDKGKNIIKSFYKEGNEFNITIKSFDEKSFYNAVVAFILLSFLGGIGSRSRRGGGNFIIKEIEGEEKLKNIINNIKNDNITEQLESLINILYKEKCVWRNLYIKKFNNDKCNNWKECLNMVGDKLMKYRSRYSNDYDIEVNFLTQTRNVKNKLYTRSIFGLPIVGRFSNNKLVKGKRFNINFVDNKGELRFASPFMFSLNKDNNGYYLVSFIKSIPNNHPTIRIKEISKYPVEDKILFFNSNIQFIKYFLNKL